MSIFDHPRMVDCGSATLALYEQGSGDPVIFCHGFPELAFSWRYQLPAIAKAGFRAIAVDMRGYGASDRPDGVASYRQHELIGDLDGLLAALGYDDAYWVGHDWGALLLWQYALLRPERVKGLINLNIPFAPRR
ncbi:MAG: alpha/beta fold hydrolase, partial [Pseudomonadota bacterium]